MWMDHRAVDETDTINATKHRVLDFVGGQMSPEMQVGPRPRTRWQCVVGPAALCTASHRTARANIRQMGKLSWLKQHLPDAWKRAAHFFDLPDFLTYRATGETTRSLCSLVCKWAYVDGHPDFAEVRARIKRKAVF